MTQQGQPTPIWAVLTAAGSGQRLGADVPKALVTAEGDTLLELALARLLAIPGMKGVVVTHPPGYGVKFQALVHAIDESERTTVVPGGASRQGSVKEGLDALALRGTHMNDVVLVHDAARCLAPTELMEQLIATIDDGADAVIPALPVTDTIKQVSVGVEGAETVVATLARTSLRIAQTPQAFRAGVLWNAHTRAIARAGDEATAATDDAALVEEFGAPVRVIPGSELAFKVTTPEDLERLSVSLSLESENIEVRQYEQRSPAAVSWP